METNVKMKKSTNKIKNRKGYKHYHNLIILIAVIFVVVLSLIVNYLAPPQIQLAPADEYRIFVTRETFDGGFGSIFGADAICTNLAQQAGLPGNNWRAWLGNQYISISEHLDHSTKQYVIYDSEGTSFIVANNWDDLLDGNINVPINLNQFGEVLGSERVWTGTKADGSLSMADCKNWHGTAKVFFGVSGLTSVTDNRWTQNSDIDQCGFPRHIYCVQQPDIIQQRIRVFVTSDRYSGDFADYVDNNEVHWSGLEALDALCNDYADNANLNRPDTIGWKAWASDTQTSMESRYPHYELPFIRLADDIQIAGGWTDLTDGSLDAPINRDERGAFINEKVWTHTDFNGSIPINNNLDACSNWTSDSNQSKAERGDTTLVDSGLWTSGDIKGCGDKSRIYCFEMIQANNEVCDDGVDNDGDGLADCADDVCAGQTGQDGSICEPGREQSCSDGGDNDGDGKVDCSDEDCDQIDGCQFTGESQCDDGFDNDNDGDTDCQDLNCEGKTGPNGEICEPNGETTCNDNGDNDGDGLIDCADNSCNGVDGCEFGQERSCYDTKDNDADGQADCLDSDCSGSTACEGFTIFVTSNRYSTNQFGSVSGADTACQSLADSAGLGGQWKAWLSTQTVSTSENLCQSAVRYIKPDGTVIANEWVDLTDGTLQSPIDMDPNGNTITTGLDVWTHTALDGTTKGTSGSNTACNDWTTNLDTIRATIGRANVIDGFWTDNGLPMRCSGQARLYCIQQPSNQQEHDALCYPAGGQNGN